MDKELIIEIISVAEKILNRFGFSSFEIPPVRQSKIIFHLNLHGKWYDMVYQKIKLEEYREIKPFFNNIFKENGKIKHKGKYYHYSDVVLCVSNGYRKDRKQTFYQCDGLKVGYGKEEWGAEPGKQYYTLTYGRRFINGRGQEKSTTFLQKHKFQPKILFRKIK